jgi:hypothetical protein
MLPTYYFAIMVHQCRCPFGPSARPPVPVRPGVRPLHRLWPVAVLLANFRGCYPSFHSPSGFLHPSGSKRSAGSPPFGPPSGFARFPLTPRNRYLSLVMTADQRLRFATFPEACCSSNLLEPSSLCAQDSFSSTRLRRYRALFNKIFLLLFHRVAARVR